MDVLAHGNPYGVRSWREQNAEETGLADLADAVPAELIGSKAMRWLFVALLGACSFRAHELAHDASADAPSDGLTATCTPNETACDGRVRKVCGASGTWDTTLDTTCDFTCSAGACVKASNVAITAVATVRPGRAGARTADGRDCDGERVGW